MSDFEGSGAFVDVIYKNERRQIQGLTLWWFVGSAMYDIVAVQPEVIGGGRRWSEVVGEWVRI